MVKNIVPYQALIWPFLFTQLYGLYQIAASIVVVLTIFIIGFSFFLLKIKTSETSRIHFIDVNGDCILIESNGHYALIDGGEDRENPSGKQSLAWIQGTEEHVLNYLNEHAKSSDGKIHLDFVIGTHSHSDHIGGLRHVVEASNVVINQFFLKEYNSAYMNSDNLAWDNQEEYDLLIDALGEKEIPITSDSKELREPIKFGSLLVQLYNTDNLDYEISSESDKVDENANSIAALVTTNTGKKVFLGADLNAYPNPQHPEGIEIEIAKLIGKVDVIKLNHHGVIGSNTSGFLDLMKPKIAIATWNGVDINPETKEQLKKRNIKTYTVHQNNDLVLDLNVGDFGINKYKEYFAQ